MIDLRFVYRRAEEHTKIMVASLFVILALLIILQSIFSPTVVLAAIAFLVALFFTFKNPLYTLGFLAVYLPFESFVLKFIPDEIYIFARYFSEGLIYLIALVVLLRVVSGKLKLKSSPVDLPFLLFIVCIVASAVINFVPPQIAILGARQILRFMLVFFLVIYLSPTRMFIRKITYIMFGVVLLQSCIGIMQSVIGFPMDQFLLPSDQKSIGSLVLTQGVNQFWDPGSRVFATLGRYDRFGNFLYTFLILATGFLFVHPRSKKIKEFIPWVFLFGLPVLVLTYSRASWFAFLIGFIFIGLIIKRDKRVAAALATFIIGFTLILAGSGLQVSLITEGPGQTLTERFFESFSLARWRGEYYGLGRVYWFVHTPRDVISQSPIFGWGPGQFGGGAAAALKNTTAYEAAGVPFGVFGTEGFIDNNWFSLWGEVGTLGIVFYLWMYVGLFIYSIRLFYQSKDKFIKSLSIGLAALMLAVGFNAMTSTVLEIRTLSYYLWLYAGFVVVLGNRKIFKKQKGYTKKV